MHGRVLVCDDEAGLREMLGVLLRRAGCEVVSAAGVAAARALIAGPTSFDAIITDLAMPDGTGMEVLEAARARDERTQVLMVTAYGTTEQAVQAMRLGAYDFIEKPFRNHELLALVEKALEKASIVDENRTLRAQVEGRAGRLLGRSSAMARVIDLVHRVAESPTSVLITGESGTGKERVARALHEASPRASQPFVVVNCGAIPEALMESELFGHEKGAFTGAHARKDGLFKQADRGTLFLDEVGELPLALQVKLLRVLQERVVRPLGATKDFEVDVRVVAATNRSLETEVGAGRFRQDLFYRLNVIRVHLPPLRERREDIGVLAEHFLRKHSALQRKRLQFDPAVLHRIEAAEYAGNVRELENLVERCVAFARGPSVLESDLPDDVGGRPATRGAEVSPMITDGFDLDAWLAGLERGMVVKALEECGGSQKKAARRLGMSFHAFRYRLKKFGLAESEETP